ncbi:hypothetical protein DAKH74_008150 [Maudiozyma humilis]|uniref:Uncharacterized protein n=1 Tax=Maudiozyma humilis TaxID=51915 RepID=A0AAV5RUJ4_MAUHU|nr:hypothetical protein DAKH74_008150 [Kazachstania humilis]
MSSNNSINPDDERRTMPDGTRLRMSNNEFRAKAREVHDDKYDYSMTMYAGKNGLITYGCEFHGFIEQKAGDHLSGYGCPLCGRNGTITRQHDTTETFIAKSLASKGERFTYERTVYVDREEDVIVTCVHHGDITVQPKKFLPAKIGCDACVTEGQRNRTITRSLYTNESFIAKIMDIFGEDYKYDQVEYTSSHGNVKMTCKVHGSFTQAARHLLNKKGCSKCASFQRWSSKGTDKFGGKYKYNILSFKTTNHDTIIKCEDHGFFTQNASEHTRAKMKTPCPVCNANSRLTTVEQFIRKARLRHGDTYGYDAVVLGPDNIRSLVRIFCRNCNLHFEQVANNHLAGNGCPVCCESFGERAVRVVLDSTEEEYVAQKRFDGLEDRGALRIDFFLPRLNLAIEFDGEQHFHPVERFGGESRFRAQQRKDGLKTDFCRSKRINFLRLKNVTTVQQEVAMMIRLIRNNPDKLLTMFYGDLQISD